MLFMCHLAFDICGRAGCCMQVLRHSAELRTFLESEAGFSTCPTVRDSEGSYMSSAARLPKQVRQNHSDSDNCMSSACPNKQEYYSELPCTGENIYVIGMITCLSKMTRQPACGL